MDKTCQTYNTVSKQSTDTQKCMKIHKNWTAKKQYFLLLISLLKLWYLTEIMFSSTISIWLLKEKMSITLRHKVPLLAENTCRFVFYN